MTCIKAGNTTLYLQEVPVTAFFSANKHEEIQDRASYFNTTDAIAVCDYSFMPFFQYN